MSTQVILLTGLVGMTFLGSLAIALQFYGRRDQQRAALYRRDEQRSDLEAMRKSLEMRIYDLEDRLVSTTSRWRDVNHLLIESQNYQTHQTESDNIVMSSFLRNAGLLPNDLEQDPKLVFVLTPFNDKFAETFSVIAGVCHELGMTPMRGDEEYVEGDLLQHILRLLVRARLVIANIDGRNPNVFYELGIAHALGKTTVLCASSIDETLAFDVRARKILIASSPKMLQEGLRREISRALV